MFCLEECINEIFKDNKALSKYNNSLAFHRNNSKNYKLTYRYRFSQRNKPYQVRKKLNILVSYPKQIRIGNEKKRFNYLRILVKLKLS